jgi:hypothetical protein
MQKGRKSKDTNQPDTLRISCIYIPRHLDPGNNTSAAMFQKTKKLVAYRETTSWEEDKLRKM